MANKKSKNKADLVTNQNVSILIPIFQELGFKFPSEAADIYLLSGWNEKYKPEKMQEIYRELDKTLILMPKEYNYKL